MTEQIIWLVLALALCTGIVLTTYSMWNIPTAFFSYNHYGHMHVEDIWQYTWLLTPCLVLVVLMHYLTCSYLQYNNSLMYDFAVENSFIGKCCPLKLVQMYPANKFHWHMRLLLVVSSIYMVHSWCIYGVLLTTNNNRIGTRMEWKFPRIVCLN